jgi:hypothetical protein
LCAEIWPNFFIVGAGKAGTTSLYEYLRLSAGVYMSPVKEPYYFTPYANSSIFPYYVYRNRREYLNLFKAVKDEKAIGEASTPYLWDKEAAKRIQDVVPDARIIIILRDPVSRAFSHYLMDMRAGIETRPVYHALQRDYTQEKKGWGISHLYVEMGYYYEQVKRYLDTFEKEKVKILIFEEFVGDTKHAVREVLKFLAVESDVPDDLVNEAYNDFSLPRLTPKIVKFVTNSTNRNPTLHKIKQLVPYSVRQTIVGRILLKQAIKPKMDQKARMFLEKIYYDDVMKLESLIGRSLPWPLVMNKVRPTDGEAN